MPDTKETAPSIAMTSLGYLARGLIAPAVVFVFVYFVAGSLPVGLLPLNAALSRALITILVTAPAVYVSITKFRDLRRADLARDASAKVAEQLDRLKVKTAVADISTKAVTDSLKDVKVDPAQLARIVEQQKQQLLIDDEYFRAELRDLIVTYLQPLPRNAKRLVNRFRVNLLIANRRGLLTSEPKVTPRQVGKWMVLLERWPQLGRSLSAVPEKMRVLEDQSVVEPKPKIVDEQSSPTASAAQGATQDEFMQTVKSLAEPYVGDEDLRKFIRSDPLLATVLQRLVHYGSSETHA